MKYVLTALTAAVALLGGAAAAAPSSDTASSRPYTLVQGQELSAFAQDGNHIAWIENSQPCHRLVRLRNLTTRKTVYLTRPGGPTCSLGNTAGNPGAQMALAGKRALWSYWNSSISHYQMTMVAASPTMRETMVDEFEADKSEERGYPPPPIPMAGENKTLVFAQLRGEYTNTRTHVVLGSKAIPIKGTDDTVVVDAGRVPGTVGREYPADRFAIQRVSERDKNYGGPIAWEVQLRTMRDGSARYEYDMSKPAKALAIHTTRNGTTIALLTDDRIQIRIEYGILLSSIPVPKNTAPELSFAGRRWVVFRTGRVIRGFDRNTGKLSVLAVADGQVHGLSSTSRSGKGSRSPYAPAPSRYRVAWIEERGEGRDRIRAINLPYLP